MALHDTDGSCSSCLLTITNISSCLSLLFQLRDQCRGQSCCGSGRGGGRGGASVDNVLAGAFVAIDLFSEVARVAGASTTHCQPEARGVK